MAITKEDVFPFDPKSTAYIVKVAENHDPSLIYHYGTFTSKEAADKFVKEDCNGFKAEVIKLMRIMR
jgi:hypothetical protein